MVSQQRRQWITGSIRLGLLLLLSLFFYASFGRTSLYFAPSGLGNVLSVLPLFDSGLSALACILLTAGLTWLGGVLAERSKYPVRPVSVTILLLLAIWITQKWTGIFILGISFYSLQAIGYLFDIKDKAHPAEKNPLFLLLFLSFFPLSVQGPICRYGDFRKQIERFLSPSSALTEMPATSSTPVETSSGLSDSFQQKNSSCWKRGIGRMVWGAFKKLVIADRIALMTTVIFRQSDSYQGGYVLLGLFAYTIQLYADFTGGIDIALGLAHCLGFSLPENFDHPFLAHSLADYWRRWHISLGNWFRDYVFYPITLSAASFLSRFRQRNRFQGSVPSSGIAGTAGAAKHRLPVRQLSVWIATLLTWSLTGLWHGLEPRFLLWGLLNGGILLLSQIWDTYKKKGKRNKGKIFLLLQMARTFVLTSLLRSLDCYPDIHTAGRQLVSVLTAPFRLDMSGELLQRGGLPGLTMADSLLLLICFAGYFLIRWLFSCYRRSQKQHTVFDYWLYPAGCVLLLLATLLFGVYGPGYDASGFIYGGFV